MTRKLSSHKGKRMRACSCMKA